MLPTKSIFIDGSNLYQDKGYKYFDQNLMLALEEKLLELGLKAVYVGHANRLNATLKKYPKNRLFFEIPKKCNFANDDLVWQLLALKYQKPFFTKDMARDHRRDLSKQFYDWYQMNWFKRLGSTSKNLSIERPPKYWRRVQLNQNKIMLPDPTDKDSWYVVELS